MESEQKLPETYAQAMAELNQIVAKMQSDNCDIDTLAAQTSRSLQLLKFCKEKLLKTDAELKKLLEEL